MQESNTKALPSPVDSRQYAGFWRRFFAACIDMFAYLPVYLGLRLAFDQLYAPIAGMPAANPASDFAVSAALEASEMHRWQFESSFAAIALFSYAWFFSSRWQGSPGMRLFDFRVTDTFGRRIGFYRALAWGITGTFAWILCCAGVLYLQKDLQATHDMLMSCQEQKIDAADCVPEIEKIIGMPFSNFMHLTVTAAGLTCLLFLIWALSIALPRDKTGFHNLICGTRFLKERA